MSRYIKKHRRQFMGVALPLFFLFVLGAIGLSVFPGWINNSYGTPGQSCNTNSDCDLCADELCQFNSASSTSQCANFPPPFGNPNFNPATTDTLCPDPESPTCFDICQVVIDSAIGPVGKCFADNAFCQGISGGDQANACRTAVCSLNFQNISDPSGCGFDFNSAAVSNDPPACVLCSTPQPAGFNACGDGICEAGLGENCTSCPIDCLVPGFDDVCPVTDPVILDNACFNQPAIVFSGPPFNITNSGTCEDGEVCTRSTCINNTCDNSPSPCDTNADFCCPAGCNAPVNGSCSGVSNCDIDCLPPVECPFCGNNIIDAGEQCDGTAANNCAGGCNDATCQCNPGGFLEGDGVGISTCSLHPQQTLDSYQGASGFIGLALALAGLVMLRRRAN